MALSGLGTVPKPELRLYYSSLLQDQQDHAKWKLLWMGDGLLFIQL